MSRLAHVARLLCLAIVNTGVRGDEDETVTTISRADTDDDVYVGTWLYVGFLFLVIAAAAALAYFLLKRQKDEGSHEVNDWKYITDGGNVVGPVSSMEMRQRMSQGQINRSTKVRITWWTTHDFQTVDVLFPEAGTEFLVPAKIDWQAAANDNWHQNSKHSVRGCKLAGLQWSYAAPDGQVYGSYENGKMRHWFSEGYLPPITPLRLDSNGNGQWCKLADVFPDTKKAFAVLPRLLLEKEDFGESMSRKTSLGAHVYGVPSTASGKAPPPGMNNLPPTQTIVQPPVKTMPSNNSQNVSTPPVASGGEKTKKQSKKSMAMSNAGSMLATSTEKVGADFSAEPEPTSE
eukprot:TRINITY_DN114434_c0_g1_i1.p1 TRINITY_DN114434_c0_g1~~TRINITY_DN114434_c0_g1_i1.p1  ORF type:complete len:346 (-),score=54.62 TRINITY_DN114434_c0_g1_i1:113-1150(-)